MIKKGDIVGRKSYGKDIFFIVDDILKTSFNNYVAVLKGLNIRIVADSLIDDLEIISTKDILKSVRMSEMSLENRIRNFKNIRTNMLKRQKICTGKVLHLDRR